MALEIYERVGDFTDDEATNKGGRTSVDAAQLDAELDAIQAVLDSARTLLSMIQRDDGTLEDGVLLGHEFSADAITYLATVLGTSIAFAWRGAWANDTDYVVGNIVESSGSSYICVANHTSASSPATFAMGSNWQLFAVAGSLDGLPTTPGADPETYVLGMDGGGNLQWVRVIPDGAPLLAPKADAALTGTTTAEVLTLSGLLTAAAGLLMGGRLKFTPLAVAFSAGGNSFDFSTSSQKTVDISGHYTSACSTANRVSGGVQEILFTNTSGGEVNLLWNSAWAWMGYAPSTLAAGKKALLHLRCYGTAESDVVALWSVQP